LKAGRSDGIAANASSEIGRIVQLMGFGDFDRERSLGALICAISIVRQLHGEMSDPMRIGLRRVPQRTIRVDDWRRGKQGWIAILQHERWCLCGFVRGAQANVMGPVRNDLR
jgi:hypothetical protein